MHFFLLYFTIEVTIEKKFIYMVYLCEFDWTWEKVYTTSVCLPCQSAGSHTKPKIPRINNRFIYTTIYRAKYQ